MIRLAIAFVVLDLAALAVLGPVTPSDSVADVVALYGDDGTRVLVSRFLHCLGLIAALALFGLLRARLRDEEGGAGTLSAMAYGGFIAVVPVELVRNVVMAALALRFDDIGDAALGLHVVAVLLGPAIAFPLAAALGALAVLRRSPVLAVVAVAWVASGARLLTTSSVVWYAGISAFAASLVVLLHLAIRLDGARSAVDAERHGVRSAGAHSR